MLGIEIKKIEDLFAKGYIEETAKAISNIKLQLFTAPTRELIRQQQVIAQYRRIDQSELRKLIQEFIGIVKRRFLVKDKIFVVHGWDHELKLEAKNYFQNTLGYESIILHEQDGEGDTIINKFEKFAKECFLAIVLLSEKDASNQDSFSDPNAPKRARPNVLFEFGYFFALLGRRRVIILRKGNVEIHSDILGIEYIDVTNGIESAGEKIRKRLAWLLAQP